MIDTACIYLYITVTSLKKTTFVLGTKNNIILVRHKVETVRFFFIQRELGYLSLDVYCVVNTSFLL